MAGAEGAELILRGLRAIGLDAELEEVAAAVQACPARVAREGLGRLVW